MIEILAAKALETVAAKALETVADKALETPVEKYFTNLENFVNIEPTEKEKIADWWVNNINEQDKTEQPSTHEQRLQETPDEGERGRREDEQDKPEQSSTHEQRLRQTPDEGERGHREDERDESKPKRDAYEEDEYMGGSYEVVKWNYAGHGDKYEVHHMPADSASELPRSDGPAIAMDYADHLQTASHGNSKEAIEYRQAQRELIEQGKFQEAFQMDVNDIRAKFGDKYDKAIAEAQEYAKKLEEEGSV